MVYCVVVITGLMAVMSLAVDLSRARMVKTELQAAADSASLFASAQMRNSIKGTSAAYANAKAAAAQNTANGKAVSLSDSDIELGHWDTQTRTFTVKALLDDCNAVRVTARCTTSNGNAVSLFFGALMKKTTVDVSASSITLLQFDENKDFTVNATSNPWLAGMPNGSVANKKNPAKKPDYAPKASPLEAEGVTLNAGESLTFDGVNGGANNSQSKEKYTADGNTGWIGNNAYSKKKGVENGMSDLYAPMNSLIGVFLDDETPDSYGTVPSVLDFSTSQSREFTALSPEMRQPFFIGDGRTTDGTVQQFTVPKGATRLFVGTMDIYEWNNNSGSFSFSAHNSGKVVLVK